jgi:2-polyprenyl-3-methyl-5-hydroxy-6-metoxy-1,4-benzoquinol methylase
MSKILTCLLFCAVVAFTIGLQADGISCVEGVSAILPKFEYDAHLGTVKYELVGESGRQKISISQTYRTRSVIVRQGLMPLQWLEPREGTVCLDAGAGEGGLVGDLRTAHVNVVGIDLRVDPILKSETFREMDMRRTTFADGTFELIYSIASLPTYKSFDQVVTFIVLKEFSRILRPGGIIRLSPVDLKTIRAVLLNIPELYVSGFGGPIEIVQRKDWGKDYVEITKRQN